ncbi:hypothetical protein [Leisingera sp. ANG-Vp]|uniref:hypothetical protein n=1 Tax=Leisingera sp. ANG-Vp TaxID=1577896 RepID=UPI00057E30EA|nr:hypothetical protein [Leisingera sp. ANG-Vp]KIC21855.1 hypothetical protein RA20_02785 [Leisingera sp. ANG-Vp]
MATPGKLSSCSAAVWLLVTGSTALANSGHTIQLQCDAPLRQPLCEALTVELQGRFPSAAVTAADSFGTGPDLTLRYVGQARSADWVSGYLAWQHSDGRNGQGPVIEHSVMDGQLTPDSLSDFAGQLVRHTEFPL